MVILPGVNSPSTLDMIDMIRVNSKKSVNITLMDNSENPVSIDESIDVSGEPSGEVYLEVTDLSGSVLYSESYWPPTLPDERRITNPSPGKYAIKWGDEDNETTSVGTLLFNWTVRKDSSSEDFYRTQVSEIVSPRTLSLLPKFRLLLDKSLKVILPEEFCTLGYSDAQLIIYLQAGLSRINSAQPYVAWQSIDHFPIDMYFEILTRSALLYALTSQFLFSVDTDINYTDQGHSFFVTHGTQLKSLIDSLTNELNRDIREFKLHFVNSGSVMSQLSLGWGFYQMLASSPPGSLFRNTYSNL